MNISKKILPLAKLVFDRQLCSVAQQKKKELTTKKMMKIKKIQKMYQIDDGEPVWQKSAGDKLLYKFSIMMIVFGLGWGLYTILYEISYVKHFKS